MESSSKDKVDGLERDFVANESNMSEGKGGIKSDYRV